MPASSEALTPHIQHNQRTVEDIGGKIVEQKRLLREYQQHLNEQQNALNKNIEILVQLNQDYAIIKDDLPHESKEACLAKIKSYDFAVERGIANIESVGVYIATIEENINHLEKKELPRVSMYLRNLKEISRTLLTPITLPQSDSVSSPNSFQH